MDTIAWRWMCFQKRDVAGLMGYNGVLCAIALGGTTRESGIWAGYSVLLSTVLQILGMSLGITTLTAPFVISVWIIQMVQ